MLAIQPVSFKSYTRPAFGQRFDDGDDSLEGNRAFFEDQKAELQGLMDDDKLPNGMKKGLKVVSVITDGIIAGISVACATIAGAKWGKGVYSRAAKSNAAKRAAEKMKPLEETAAKKAEGLKEFASNLQADFLKTSFGKKVNDLYNSFADTRIGKTIVNFSKKVYEKAAKFVKSLNIFKSEETYDKATKKTATFLGAGSGVASAYATAVKESELGEAEE